MQYIHTPWRDQQELLAVRQQFYPSSLPPSTNANISASAGGSAIGTSPSSSITVSLASTYHLIALSTDPRYPADDPRVEGDDEDAALAQEAEKRQQQAVSRVSMWMQRGGCPHMIESTALLTAAILSDLHESRTRANSSSYAIRAAYSAAFSRCVILFESLCLLFIIFPSPFPYHFPPFIPFY